MDNSKIPPGVNPQDYPDFWDQMNNFQKFLKDVNQGKSEGNGSIIVSQEKRLERVDICNQCPHFNSDSKRCYKCGCFMEIKWRFKKSSCPINLW